MGFKAFTNRMCKVCARPQTLTQDMKRAFNFRRNKEDAYKKKIDTTVEKNRRKIVSICSQYNHLETKIIYFNKRINVVI